MDYKTVTAISRYGPDDYSAWTADLPASFLADCEPEPLEDNLKGYLDGLPVSPLYAETSLNLLFQTETGPCRCTLELPEDFWNAYVNEGGSVRGSQAELIDEMEAALTPDIRFGELQL